VFLRRFKNRSVLSTRQGRNRRLARLGIAPDTTVIARQEGVAASNRSALASRIVAARGAKASTDQRHESRAHRPAAASSFENVTLKRVIGTTKTALLRASSGPGQPWRFRRACTVPDRQLPSALPPLRILSLISWGAFPPRKARTVGRGKAFSSSL